MLAIVIIIVINFLLLSPPPSTIDAIIESQDCDALYELIDAYPFLDVPSKQYIQLEGLATKCATSLFFEPFFTP